MARLHWSDMEAIYAIANIDAEGSGSLTISTQKVLEALLLIRHDEYAAEESGIQFIADDPQLEMMVKVELQFNSPRTGFGRFGLDFASLIAGAKARVEEPINYFVVEGGLTRRSAEPIQAKYRSTLEFVALLAEAASYMDGVQQELVFFRDGKIVVPIDYGVDDLLHVDTTSIEKLVDQFSSPVHRDQKLAILSEATIDISAGLQASKRFRQLLREVAAISEKIEAGYKLFASSFSYSKVRKEVESAQSEFIVRIHKTFVDLQGQILGIPIATIVVASQLKLAKACGVEVWTNIAVVTGAWIFAVFLLASIANQWFTLSAIQYEFGRQKERLVTDFSAVSASFTDAYDSLNTRTFWHRVVFAFVGAVGLTGAIFATWVADKLIEINVSTCL